MVHSKITINYLVMLMILSPAKIQNFNPQSITSDYTLPVFMNEADELIKELRSYSSEELSGLLETNHEITTKAVFSYSNWTPRLTLKNGKQAMYVYNGEVYRGLNAASFSAKEIEYAQKHLRIISGLYGVLRPLDLIEPYRLEMKTQLGNSKGKDLYAFWKAKITTNIKQAIVDSDSPPVLLNLASNEFFKAIDKKMLNIPVVHFDFLENRHGVYKSIVIYTKKARGLMARYIIQNQINQLKDLQQFDAADYWYNEDLSSEYKLVFCRG